MMDMKQKKKLFGSLSYEQKKTHLTAMLEPARDKIDFLSVIYDYVTLSDDSVEEEVWMMLYESILDLMDRFNQLDDASKEKAKQALLAQIRKQSTEDQAGAEDILSQL